MSLYVQCCYNSLLLNSLSLSYVLYMSLFLLQNEERANAHFDQFLFENFGIEELLFYSIEVRLKVPYIPLYNGVIYLSLED